MQEFPVDVKTIFAGTTRRSKKEIPLELLSDRQYSAQSSILCFDRQLTLVNNVRRKGDAAILLSSMHHSIY
jgi:hypothetical protein